MTSTLSDHITVSTAARFPLIPAAINQLQREQSAIDENQSLKYSANSSVLSEGVKNTNQIKVANEQPIQTSASSLKQSANHKQTTCRTTNSKRASIANHHLHQVASDSKTSAKQISASGHYQQVHYYDEFNRMREKLFRLLSKVPIQVEPMINCNGAQSSTDNPAGGSSSASSPSQQSTSRQAQQQHTTNNMIDRKPLLIKYYNEKSLDEILDLHFNCSLLKFNFENNLASNLSPEQTNYSINSNQQQTASTLFTNVEACGCFLNTPTTFDNHHPMPTYSSANSINFYDPQQQQLRDNNGYIQPTINANQACMMDWQHGSASAPNHLSSSWHVSSSSSSYEAEQRSYNVRTAAILNGEQQLTTTTIKDFSDKKVTFLNAAKQKRASGAGSNRSKSCQIKQNQASTIVTAIQQQQSHNSTISLAPSIYSSNNAIETASLPQGYDESAKDLGGANFAAVDNCPAQYATYATPPLSYNSVVPTDDPQKLLVSLSHHDGSIPVSYNNTGYHQTAMIETSNGAAQFVASDGYYQPLSYQFHEANHSTGWHQSETSIAEHQHHPVLRQQMIDQQLPPASEAPDRQQLLIVSENYESNGPDQFVAPPIYTGGTLYANCQLPLAGFARANENPLPASIDQDQMVPDANGHSYNLQLHQHLEPNNGLV